MWETIERLGKEMGFRPVTVRQWRRRGVPHRLRLKMLRMAAERGLVLLPEEFDPLKRGNGPDGPERR